MEGKPETHCELGMGWAFCMRKKGVGRRPIPETDVMVDKDERHLVDCQGCLKMLNGIEASRAGCVS